MKTLFAVPITCAYLDNHFGHSEEIALITVTDKKVDFVDVILAPSCEPHELPKFLREIGVKKAITGIIDYKITEKFKNQAIEVISGAPMDKPAVLVQKYLDGNLKTNNKLRDN